MSFALKTIIKRTLTAACLGSVILATTSCSMFKGVEDPTEGWTADKLYVEARDNLNEGNYETARDYYQKLEARYPYGRYSQQAQVETAYSYFKEGEPQQAIAVCDRFLRQYPEHPLSPYALYIKGIATLDEDEGWMSYLTRQDLSKRDAQAARDAFDIFKDAIDKMVDHSCDEEMETQLRTCVMRNPNVHKIDVLRTRIFGNKIYVDVEIALDGSITLQDAHDVAEKVHNDIEKTFPKVKHIMVHVNPAKL